MSNPAQDAQRLGQSIWYDNIRRGLLVSGELQQLLEQGVTGVTSNPTIFEKAIAGSTDYDDALRSLAAAGKDVPQIYEALVVEDIRATADLLRHVYEATGGVDGYVSLEVSPALARDTQGTVAEARRLFAALDRPNVMVKVPATPQGIPAVRQLIGAGINVNVTLIFSLAAHRQVMEAYIAGLEELDQGGGDVGKVASVASFFVSRVDTAVDNLLEGLVQQGNEEAEDLLGKAAIANAKLAYEAFHHVFDGTRFAELRAKGARVQRPLWASTGTKNPAYSDLLYVESLVGSDTVNTVPPATLTALLDHGVPALTLERDVEAARRVMEALAAAGISIDEVTDKLLADGVQSFADSFDKLMANIQEKKERLLAQEHDHDHPGVSLGALLQDVEATLADLHQRDAVGRIWRKDHTLWKPDPREISDRLGWLNVTEVMSEQVPAMEALATEVRDEGFRHVVLLGMGGSSLGPEVLRQAFGSAAGYPELIVLDSTVPAWVRAVTGTIDPAKTLFLVSSKSGGTIESNALYRHFRALVDDALGKDRAGMSFVAITDPDTPLERLGRSEGFRRVFLNPSDIGGRYSVLSYFGLVPAALMGLDIAALMDRADAMREGCASCVPAHENPGAFLGAAMGALARHGRDKLTLVTSPAIGSFGLWAEQLIAESTGKEGIGIVPVAGEPLAGPGSYGEDRLFVYLRLDEDENHATDAAMERIESSGQPVLRLRLRDRYDLGAEFFRWEFATAMSGAVLGIHPFDQPDVQSAKDQTDLVLGKYLSSSRLPEAEVGSSLAELLGQARAGDYLAIMAYLRPGP
ncbi:MAG: bifunctional transaldolase/phosoglucose isomerase [Chloroflexi bacterium]|nr:bifunctional transaldolase/phosoglucose isomerase [Chloroflexota bacterium]